MPQPSVDQLLQNLHNNDEKLRERATQALWNTWFEQKGVVGLQRLQRAQLLLQTGQIERAIVLLDQLIAEMPDFAEAWNRRAVLYFTQQRYAAAIDDCQVVVHAIPIHFGAWSGMARCYAALNDYQQAIVAVRRALDLQPYALENQRLLLECTAQLT
ncbi:tetratricopeptide repeat protein [filamentous cyanobacterium LEGE 11480]|uniref:Tetratricopeptide repeat protein n=1 Tax=Romeriopsis navalis LEGE 11480 TaxID=2777977 RepID=A0A928VKX5_9CYAN|nr:tetratricopeptide repeat protein [Romeriopsis navalis]MBE9028267.1 tetratricopeptide repeat protein [Romeriopsis navalis LEGE 11480]